jgi:hypothetical protein
MSRELAAVARGLYAPEGELWVVSHHPIDEDGAGLEVAHEQLPFGRSLVQALDPRPKSVALANSIASSVLSTRNNPATGPNTSSENIRISVVISVTTVGG